MKPLRKYWMHVLSESVGRRQKNVTRNGRWVEFGNTDPQIYAIPISSALHQKLFLDNFA